MTDLSWTTTNQDPNDKPQRSKSLHLENERLINKPPAIQEESEDSDPTKEPKYPQPIQREILKQKLKQLKNSKISMIGKLMRDTQQLLLEFVENLNEETDSDKKNDSQRAVTSLYVDAKRYGKIISRY